MKPLLGTLVGLGLLAACSGSGVPASAPAASAPAKPAASRPAGISAAPSAAGKLEPLKMAYGAAVLQQLPLWTAYEAGLFKEYGFDPAPPLLASGRTALDSLIANQVDLISAGAYQTALTVGSGAQVRMIGAWSNKEPFTIFAQQSIADPKQLAGKKVGTLGPASESGIAFGLYLKKIGMATNAVTYITMDSVGSENAGLASGAIDACAVIPPIPPDTAAKVHPLDDLAKASIAWIPNSWVTSQNTVEQQPDKAARMLEALEKGGSYAYANPEFSKGLLEKYMKMAKADQDQAFEMFKTLQAKNYVPTQEALDTVMNQLLENQKDLTKEKIAPFYSSKILDQLKANGFLDKNGATAS